MALNPRRQTMQVQISAKQFGKTANAPSCMECIFGNEDPAPWCDCRSDERCKGPCRRRAHDPKDCPERTKNG